jgi:sugar phosphate isomerase/epimerase
MCVENAFAAASSIGYDGVEVMVSPEKNSQSFVKLSEFSEKYKIQVTSIHAPTLLACKFVYSPKLKEKVLRSVDLAEKLGADSVVIHPPLKRDTLSNKTKFLELMKDLQKRTDVHLAVENMYPWGFRGHEIELYSPSYEIISRELEHVTLDFSHAAAAGLDTVSFAVSHRDKISMLHLCDGVSRLHLKGDAIFDEHLAPGDGNMEIRETLNALKIGWSGHITLEVNTRSEKTLGDKRDLLLKILRNHHDMVDSILSERAADTAALETVSAD